ncbi:MAG: telomere resolvase [Pelatocladus maniniholoensis HA4357-MV3]|jgi:hypothetical protein|uniref:Telomere resolvase n=1 Tax=Pelatocladus maniniholoensis HA4357-MV3 TaxID=1117104 RepID=A0A9E3H5G9_9NOST|nr:telomere resolvase [Pelatocladus maniniholoensis HA4357-MV3]MBW4430949.1 telomere resolvase [Pelatocladus maniniholoensis HA4357-MV3]
MVIFNSDRSCSDHLLPKSNWRSQILKRIEKMVDRDNDSYPDNLLSQTFKLFYDSVQASFADVQRQKAESSNKSLNQRQNNAIDIKVVNLIQWAKGRLVTLPEVPSLWHQVAVALMILTGRRQSEIMSSAKFSPVGSDSYVEFSGQLKRHDGETVGAYEIPALANSAEAVIAGLQWLEDNNKRVAPVDQSYQSQQAAVMQQKLTTPIALLVILMKLKLFAAKVSDRPQLHPPRRSALLKSRSTDLLD